MTELMSRIVVLTTVTSVVSVLSASTTIQVGITGPRGPQGSQGPAGATGATGATGAAGPGVAAGGSTGQYLRKTTSSNYATYWSGLRVETFAGSLPVYGAAGYFAYDTVGQTFHLTDNDGNWHQLWPAVDANNLPDDPYLGQIAVDPNGFKTVYCWNGSLWVPLD